MTFMDRKTSYFRQKPQIYRYDGMILQIVTDRQYQSWFDSYLTQPFCWPNPGSLQDRRRMHRTRAEDHLTTQYFLPFTTNRNPDTHRTPTIFIEYHPINNRIALNGEVLSPYVPLPNIPRSWTCAGHLVDYRHMVIRLPPSARYDRDNRDTSEPMLPA